MTSRRWNGVRLVSIVAVVAGAATVIAAWALAYRPQPTPSASPTLTLLPTTEPGGEPVLREIPSDLEGFTLTIPGFGTLDRVKDNERSVTLAPEGQVFVWVHTLFHNENTDPGVEVVVSTEGAQLEGPDGVVYPVNGGGSADDGACADCTIEVSTSEQDIYLGFLFAVPAELNEPGLRFVFTFREAAPIPFVL